MKPFVSFGTLRQIMLWSIRYDTSDFAPRLCGVNCEKKIKYFYSRVESIYAVS